MKTKREVMEGKKVVRLKKKKVIKIKERGEHEQWKHKALETLK